MLLVTTLIADVIAVIIFRYCSLSPQSLLSVLILPIRIDKAMTRQQRLRGYPTNHASCSRSQGPSCLEFQIPEVVTLDIDA